MSRSTALITWNFPCRTLFNQFSFQKYIASQYQKLILIWFLLPFGQRTVLGEILIGDSLHQIFPPFHHTQLCGPYYTKPFLLMLLASFHLSFLEWSLSLTFPKYSMSSNEIQNSLLRKSQTLLVYCDKQKMSHRSWNEFKILRFDSSKNSHSHWVLHNFNRKCGYNLGCH